MRSDNSVSSFVPCPGAKRKAVMSKYLDAQLIKKELRNMNSDLLSELTSTFEDLKYWLMDAAMAEQMISEEVERLNRTEVTEETIARFHVLGNSCCCYLKDSREIIDELAALFVEESTKKLAKGAPPPKSKRSRLVVLPSKDGMEGEAVMIDDGEKEEEQEEK